MVAIIKALLNSFFNAFLQAFLDLLTKRIGTTASQILGMVTDLDKETLTNEEKASKLLNQLKVIAINNGKELATNDAKLAIEVAVKVVRGGK